MPDDFNLPGWFPFDPRDLFPGSTPSIPDQIRCPPGQHRDIKTGGCVANAPPPTTEGTLGEIADEGFVGPVPSPRPRVPPKVPGPPPVVQPPAGPGPSPADVLPRSLPSQLPLPRQRTTRLPTLGAVVGRLGALAWVLGTLVFSPYFYPRAQPESSGPPRRRRPRAGTTPDVPPYYRYEGPWPYLPGMPLPGPFPLPGRTTRDRPAADVQPRPRTPTLPGRPRTLPGTRTPVQGVPAPAGWTLGDPITGPGYDPYTYEPARAPAPRSPPRAIPRGNPIDFPFPVGWPLRLPSGRPGSRPRTVADPLTPQQPTRAPRPSTPRRPVKTPTTTSPLTPVNPGLSPLPQYLGQPQKANPCTEQRTARRRRQRECQNFTTKTIRVCAD